MRYFLVAGEASGDLHASRVMKNLIKLDPEAEFRFFGGDKMSRYGGDPIVHCRLMSFMGFVNVLKNLGKINEIRRRAEQVLADFRPHHLILVDYPGFNLRFAEYVKKVMPQVVVHYYIAPKLWVWKEWRLKSIKKYVDHMYTILPFETEWFGSRGYQVEYVGNPSVDAIVSFRKRGFDASLFRKSHHLDERPIIALLAGSRMQEISSCLPLMADCAQQMPAYQFVVAAAPNIDIDTYHKILGNAAENVSIIKNVTYELLTISDGAIVNSGTATLEAALFRVPQVVVYKVFGGRLTMALKPFFLNTEYVSLVNIIARCEVVRELLGHHFTVDATLRELKRVLSVGRSEIIAGYDRVIETLGPSGAGERVAERIITSSR
ncbi:MAG: lipid-A-disaccharide synthase [bacterium]|nr:lipid-A-disaccharide synthase [Candidatus Minthenecus merdequi]